MENSFVDQDLDDVEQLKLKIIQVKKEIARKQLKLHKSERAAKNRSKIRKVECGDDETKSSELQGRKENTEAETVQVQMNRSGLQIACSDNGTSDHNIKVDREKAVRSRSAVISCENVIVRKRIDGSSSAKAERAISNGNEPVANRELDQLTDGIINSSFCVYDKQITGTFTLPTSSKRMRGLRTAESLPLRRSRRLSQETQLIGSGGFVSTQREREGSIENDGKTTTPSTNRRRLFPSFPNPPIYNWNVVTNFVLPDSQYAALKLKVRKTKQLLCFREDGDCVSVNSNSKDMIPNGPPLLRTNTSNRHLAINYQLESSHREPVLAVHYSHLRGSDDCIAICVVVQVGSISTWASDGKKWILFHEFCLELRDCKKSNVHRLETEFVCTTVCISHTTLWIHACDSEKRVTLNKVDLRVVHREDDRHILSCTIGIDALFVAFVGSAKSIVKKYIFTPNIKNIIKETNLEDVDDMLNSLVRVDGLERALLGTSFSKLYLWNINRKTVKVIEPQREVFNCQTCTLCVAQKGLLFLGLVPLHPKNDFRIVAVNPMTSAWTKVTHFSTNLEEITSKEQRNDRNHDKLQEMKCHGHFILTFGTMVAIWHLGTGKLMAFVDGCMVDYLTIYKRKYCSIVEIVVASNFGHVTSYSPSTKNVA